LQGEGRSGRPPTRPPYVKVRCAVTIIAAVGTNDDGIAGYRHAIGSPAKCVALSIRRILQGYCRTGRPAIVTFHIYVGRPGARGPGFTIDRKGWRPRSGRADYSGRSRYGHISTEKISRGCRRILPGLSWADGRCADRRSRHQRKPGRSACNNENRSEETPNSRHPHRCMEASGHDVPIHCSSTFGSEYRAAPSIRRDQPDHRRIKKDTEISRFGRYFLSPMIFYAEPAARGTLSGEWRCA
jgi:hypothetical protein